MASKEEQEMLAWLSGAATKPPTGFVFQDLDSSGGPPMLRMIIMQVIFGAIGSFNRLTVSFRCFVILLVCSGLMYKDYSNFVGSRTPNLYQAIGTNRAASTSQIERIFDLYY
jgi:hypothetical protein